MGNFFNNYFLDKKPCVEIEANSFNNIQFKGKPNLKYKLDINHEHIHSCMGISDGFEVFQSYKDNKEYIASPNIQAKLDIISIIDNKIILSLSGHYDRITSVRYYINNKNKNEYLISADNYLVITWDISNNYNILYKIYYKSCNAFLLVFHNINNFIIITPKIIDSYQKETKSKMYSLNNGQFIDYFHSHVEPVYYLLLWIYNNKIFL